MIVSINNINNNCNSNCIDRSMAVAGHGRDCLCGAATDLVCPRGPEIRCKQDTGYRVQGTARNGLLAVGAKVE